MRNILYIIAVVCIIAWLFGMMNGSFGSLVHILLVLAIISIIIGVIRGRSAL